ncbi:MAG: phage major capsid protein [Pseudoxanthomonas spadix]|nr:MAG: phage major capsid protein [Pseudoxanthomonas spadix]
MTTESIEKALNSHADALKAFQTNISGQLEAQKGDLEKLQDKFLQMEEKGVRLRTTPRKTEGATEVITKALDSEQFKQFSAGKLQTSGKIELELSLKALTSLQGSTASPQVGYDVQRDNLDIQLPVQQRLRILDVLPQRDTTANKVGFPLLDFSEDSAADYQAGEGAPKAEADLIADWDEASIATIAVHTTASKQVLDDVQGLVEAVQLLLRYKLANKTDIELMTGNGAQFHIKGLLTQATAFTGGSTNKPVDRIGRAAAMLASQGYSPNVVFINPLDYFDFASERSAGDGQYVAGGWSRPTNSPIYELTPVRTMAVPVGQSLVTDTAVLKVLMRERPNIQFGWVNDQFTRNLVTILAELRLGLLALDPKALLKVSLAA